MKCAIKFDFEFYRSVFERETRLADEPSALRLFALRLIEP